MLRLNNDIMSMVDNADDGTIHKIAVNIANSGRVITYNAIVKIKPQELHDSRPPTVDRRVSLPIYIQNIDTAYAAFIARGWQPNQDTIQFFINHKFEEALKTLIYTGWHTDNKDILNFMFTYGQSIGYYLAHQGWYTTDRDLLLNVTGKNTFNRARIPLLFYVTSSIFFNDKELLYTYAGGRTLAHEQAHRGWCTCNKDILQLRDVNNTTVAHVIVSKKQIHLFDYLQREQPAKLYDWLYDKDIILDKHTSYLPMDTVYKNTIISSAKSDIAYLMTNNFYWNPTDKEILTYSNSAYKLTVAHLLAYYGWTTNDRDILKLTDTFYGISVAHIQAARGWITDDPEILELTTKDGITVKEIQEYFGYEQVVFDMSSNKQHVKQFIRICRILAPQLVNDIKDDISTRRLYKILRKLRTSFCIGFKPDLNTKIK